MNAKTVMHRVGSLEKRASKKGSDPEYTRSVVFGLNTQLLALGLSMFGSSTGSSVDASQISSNDRSAVRDTIREQGSWIGHTELHVLALEFGVQMWLAVPSGNYWRRTAIGGGGGHLIANPALCWLGNHYVVATLTARPDGVTFTATNTIVTNEDGDCAFESFMTVLVRGQIRVSPRWARFRGELRVLIRTFDLADQARVNDGTAISDADQNYIDAIQDLREVLVGQLSDDDINDAIIATGALPSSGGEATSSSSKKSTGLSLGGGEWGRYVEHVSLHFRLARCLEFEQFGSSRVYTIRNTDIDASRLIERARSRRGANQILELGSGDHRSLQMNLKAYDLTHLGFMIARIRTIGADYYLVCAFANFDAQYVGERYPYKVHGSEKSLSRKSVSSTIVRPNGRVRGREVLFTAYDMHTECYSLFMLHRFIGVMNLSNIQDIRCDFILQLNMCDRCEEAVRLFQGSYAQLRTIRSYSAESGDEIEESLADELPLLGKATDMENDLFMD